MSLSAAVFSRRLSQMIANDYRFVIAGERIASAAAHVFVGTLFPPRIEMNVPAQLLTRAGSFASRSSLCSAAPQRSFRSPRACVLQSLLIQPLGDGQGLMLLGSDTVRGINKRDQVRACRAFEREGWFPALNPSRD